MASALPSPLPPRVAALAVALAWLCGAPTALAADGQASEGEWPELGGVCEEEQVERAEDELALGMRTELLQQEARRFRASAVADRPSAEALAAGNPKATRSDREVYSNANVTVTVSSYNDSELSELVHEEQNLTDYVHRQAEVVSQSTDEFARALVKVKGAAEHGADLEKRFGQVRGQAMAARQRLEGFLLVLRTLRDRRDALQNETAVVQRQLDQLSHQYGEVVREYEDLVARLPEEQGFNATAEAAMRSASQQLSDAGAAHGSAQAAVKTESWELQEAIAKLNKLNAELRAIEGQLTEKYDRMYSAALGSAWSLPLVLFIGTATALNAVVA